MRSRSVDSSLPAAIRFLALTLFAALLLSSAPNASAQSSPLVAPPQFSVAPGPYSSAQSVAITCATQGATIYYSINGSDPYTIYSGNSIAIPRSMTLEAYASTSSGSYSPITFGNFYITSVPDSFVYDVAGTNFSGLAGDGSLSIQADINRPSGIAIDKSSNIFFADSENNDIREIAASTGVISTVAGTGVAGYSGDNGPATSAQLSYPSFVAFDSSGNLYIADQGNSVIRRIDLTSGAISTYAGNSTATSLGDGGPAIDAEIFSPYAIAFDAAGNLYIEASGRIREVDANTQIITTVAGGGNPPNQYGDGGLATNASLSAAQGLALDRSGNIYIADTYDEAVRKVTRSTGIINTVAGTIGYNGGGFSGDGGPATNAKLNAPTAITFDSSGNLYIVDSSNDRIRRVDAATGIISTVEGNGVCGDSIGENGGVAANLGVCFPGGLAFDGKGNLYYADTTSAVVKVVTAVGTPPTAPTAAPIFSVAAGTYTTPQTLALTDPTPGATIYLKVDPAPPAQNPNEPVQFTTGRAYNGPINIAGSVTVAATAVAPGYMPSPTVSAAYTITAPLSSVITTVAGNGTYGSSGIGGPAIQAQLGVPSAIAFDTNGNLYIADCNSNVVWQVASSSGTISVLAGTGTYNVFWNPGPASSANLACPDGVAADSSGNVFISDSGANEVLEVLASNGDIALYAGDGGAGSYLSPNGDGGAATSATVPSPGALAVDSKGNLYIIDASYRVREVTAATGIINTVAGGNDSALGDGGPATSAWLYLPNGIALDSSGNLYIADQDQGRVRMVNAKTGIITTVAGDGDQGESGDGLLATQAEVSPQSIVVDASGNLYFSNSTAHIRKLDATTGIISPVAGAGFSGYTGDGGSPLVATICPGNGLALDLAGNLYFTDSCGYAVRKITFNAPAPAPTFNPPAGAYTSAQSVTISDTAPNAAIYYTTDGSTPTAKSTQFSGAITVTASETINAIAVAAGYGQSPVGSANYTIQATPTITWAQPAVITWPTPLSSKQLNATANVPGTFAYSPAAGTVLSPGSQTLKTTFTPADSTAYTTASASVAFAVDKATPAITFTVSPNPADNLQAVTFTAAVSSSVGNPTGSVTFWSGNSQLGTATLASGTATFTTSALTAGGYLVSAQYAGDADFTSVASNQANLNITSFVITTPSSGSTSATISPGGTATYSLSVTPPGNNAVNFSISGVPTGATSSFSPANVPAGAPATTVTLSITVPAQSAAVLPDRPGSPARTPLALALVLLPLLGARRLRKGHRILMVLLVCLVGAAGLAVLNACGGGAGNSGGGGQQQPQTYNLKVTATAGSETQSTTLTLNVQ